MGSYNAFLATPRCFGFSPLKTAYSEVLHKRSQAGEKGVWKENFYTLGGSPEDCLAPENNRSGLLGYWTSTFGLRNYPSSTQHSCGGGWHLCWLCSCTLRVPTGRRTFMSLRAAVLRIRRLVRPILILLLALTVLPRRGGPADPCFSGSPAQHFLISGLAPDFCPLKSRRKKSLESRL